MLKNQTKLLLQLLCGIFSLTLLNISCSKGGGGDDPPTNPCAGVTITVNGTSTNPSAAGVNDGTISASATGGTSFTFSLNGGTYQASGNFNGLAAGNYTVTAKDSRGCTGTKSFTLNAADPCTGQTFTVSGTTVTADPCAATPNGSITVTTANGGSNFTYNINNGPFQSSPVFNNLAANNYTVGAKEGGGCVKTANITVNPSPMGALFTVVKGIINTNCAIAGCHTGPTPTGGINFSIDCNIVINKDRIKVRAVDNFGTGQQMPPPPNAGLSLNDRNAIVTWINAGGLYTN